MSINVSVHGSPISINRGKMVCYETSSEFQRRRKIRLQQVREQSKEIAAEVRNRVRREKEKELSKAEQNGETYIKRCQQRKLLGMQQQYQDSMKLVGGAQNAANEENDPEKIIKEARIKNCKCAEVRGKRAADKQRKDEEDRRWQEETSKELRKNVRQLEDMRSAMVTKIAKEKNKSNKKKNKDKDKEKSPPAKKKKKQSPPKNNVSTDVKITQKIRPNKKTKSNGKSEVQNININISHNDNEQNTSPSRSRSPSPTLSPSLSQKSTPIQTPIISPSPSPIPSLNQSPIRSPVLSSKQIQSSSLSPIPITSPKKGSKSKFQRQYSATNNDYDSTFKSLKSQSTEILNLNYRFSSNGVSRSDSPDFQLNDSYQSSNVNGRSNLRGRVMSPDPTPPVSPKINTISSPPRITSITDKIQQRNLKKIYPIYEEEVKKADKSVETKDFDSMKSNKSVETKKPNLNVESYKICNIKGEIKKPETKRNPLESTVPTTSTTSKAPIDSVSRKLPYVPTTSLAEPSTVPTTSTQRTKYFDKFNHFRKEYETQPVIQKINKENVLVQPMTDRSETTQIKERMQVRDKIAYERGIRAWEKNKLEKDYKQLMEDLPILQRQEHLAAMKTHKPIYHMPDYRLQELEKRRQNRIENIFDKYYQKAKNLETPIVTLKPVQKPPPIEDLKLPYTALDVTESGSQMNIADWNIDEKDKPEDTNSEIGASKEKALMDLLLRVNKQRKLLLQEVASLPQNSNLQKIFKTEEMMKLICDCVENEEDETKASNSLQQLQNKVRESLTNNKIALKETKESIKPPSNESVKAPAKKSSKEKVKKESSSSSCKEKSSKSKKKRSPNTSSDSSEETAKKRKHKKVKTTKSKPQIKNEETQTTPTLQKFPSQVNQQAVENVCPCDDIFHKANTSKVCNIIIEMGKSSEVNIKTDKSVPVQTTTEDNKKRVIVNLAKPNTKITIRSPNQESSSSTTYMSVPEPPPEILQQQLSKQNQQQQRLRKPSVETIKSKQPQQYKEFLHRKPQQTNIDMSDCGLSEYGGPHPSYASVSTAFISPPNIINRKVIHPNLMKYIQKLLSMSRDSIDELAASTVSEVSTPASSIVDVNENRGPLQQLQNIMQHYNLSFRDIQEQLQGQKQKVEVDDVLYNKKQITSNSTVIECEPDCKQQIESRSEFENSPLVQEIKSKEFEEVPYVDILNRYSELTQNCCEKISQLTSMIDKVRKEKERLLSPTLSDPLEVSTTSYLDLPKKTDQQQSGSSNSQRSSPNSSTSQDVIDNYLLSIDKSSLVKGQAAAKFIVVNTVNTNPIFEEVNNDDSNDDNVFIPLLQGIPKYDSENQTKNFINSPIKNYLQSSKSKPPPSLLRNVIKHNIDMTPHELSTIVELDTIASSRNISMSISRPKTPEEQQQEEINDGFKLLFPEPSKRQNEMSPTDTTTQKPTKSVLKKDPQSPSRKLPETPVMLSIHSEESSSPENLEDMLRSMGLHWAISTLKKTQQSQALSPSSSSGDSSYKKRVSFKEASSSNSTSSSDVSLRDILQQEMFKKFSPSSSASENSNAQMLESNASDSLMQHQQRTSTPVNQTKSTSSNNQLFQNDSDLSSVKMPSDDNIYLSVPSISLDLSKLQDSPK